MAGEDSGIIISESEATRSTMLLEEKRMNLYAGWFGRLFGAKENAPTNVAGFFVLLSLAGFITLMILQGFGFAGGDEGLAKTFGVLAPMVTLVMGYMFGKN